MDIQSNFIQNSSMIHVSKIFDVIRRSTKDGQPVPFQIKFVKRSTGSVVEAVDVICTSSHFRGGTMNLKFPNGEFRKINIMLIIEFNNNEVVV